MAIPLGTTSRQLERTARWAMAGIVVVGMLCWWWPSQHSWGAMSAGILVVLCLWLIWRTVAADRSIPGQPIHLVLLVPAAVMIFHLWRTGLGTHARQGNVLAGGLNMSMVFQLGLISLGIMLTQSLLQDARRFSLMLSVCGAAMMAGTAAAMTAGLVGKAQAALTMLGFVGVATWIAAFPASEPTSKPTSPAWNRIVRIVWLGVAAIASAILAGKAYHQAVVAAGIAGICLVVAGIMFARRRALMLAVGALIAGAASVGAAKIGLLNKFVGEFPITPLGYGEQIYVISSASSGWRVMLGAAGWVGAAGLTGGMVLCALALLRHARGKDSLQQARATAWLVVVALSGAAVLIAGGLFIPAASLAFIFAWGLAPVMMGRARTHLPGAALLVATLAMLTLLGLAKRVGLMSWEVGAFGAGDVFLHWATGLIVGLMLSWMMGARNVWLGLMGLVVASLAGGAAEIAQKFASTRGVQLADWGIHCIGVACAAVPYLLAVGARLCESASARGAEAGCE